jgi:glycosyltransferase involved in cell wall biosynthesis
VSDTVAFILKGYPRLSETFIAQEIRALERLGLTIIIVSLRNPTDPSVHPIHDEIRAPVRYLPEYLHEAPLRVWGAWRAIRRRAGYRLALRTWLGDLWRDPTRNRVRRFGQALVLAHEMPAEVGRLHAHFLHTPASVARYTSLITGLPWSVSAHAKDVWTTPEWEKREKLSSCEWLVTCTAAAADHLSALAPPGAVELVYHGLDLARFPPPGVERPARDGTDPAAPVVILSVGRAVEKKGFDNLLEALAALPATLHWRFEHVGGGDLLASLKCRATELGIGDRVTWLGPLTQEALLARYRGADLFALASRVAGDGDRDGLPNVLMEAQSQGLACLATRLSGIPELIEDGVTGCLVPPGDTATLADALAALISDPQRRLVLGEAGQTKVRRNFDAEQAIQRLAVKFRLRTLAAASA